MECLLSRLGFRCRTPDLRQCVDRDSRHGYLGYRGAAKKRRVVTCLVTLPATECDTFS